MIRSPRRGLPLREPHRLLLGVQRGPGAQQRHAIVSPERGRLTYRSVVPTLEGTPAQASALQPTRSPGSGRPGPLSRNQMGGEARVEPTLRQACSRPRPRAQFAFKDSMIHIICNSHYVSHFAAFFIDTGAKISVVESCLWFLWRRWTAGAQRARRLQISSVTDRLGLFPAGDPRESWVAFSHKEAASSLGPAPSAPRSANRPGSGRTLERQPPLSFGRPATEDVVSGPHIPSAGRRAFAWKGGSIDAMILPQVHLRKPCYDFSFL